MTTATPRVSVIVVSRNERALADTLKRLHPQCLAIDAECIVVDSSTGQLHDVAATAPWVRWIDYVPPRPGQRTVSQQRNIGCVAARGDVLVFCDVGGVPDSQWLELITAPLLAGEAQATAGPLRPLHPGTYPVLNDIATSHPVPIVITANLAFTKTAFALANGFDERYVYGEDTEFGWRLADQGITVVSVHEAGMTMDWGSTRRHLRRRWMDGRGKGRQWVLARDHRHDILRRGVVGQFVALVVVVWCALVGLWRWTPVAALVALFAGVAVGGLAFLAATTRYDARAFRFVRTSGWRVLFFIAFVTELLSGNSRPLRQAPRRTPPP